MPYLNQEVKIEIEVGMGVKSITKTSPPLTKEGLSLKELIIFRNDNIRIENFVLNITCKRD
jgi:hypothetical protein